MTQIDGLLRAGRRTRTDVTREHVGQARRQVSTQSVTAYSSSRYTDASRLLPSGSSEPLSSKCPVLSIPWNTTLSGT